MEELINKEICEEIIERPRTTSLFNIIISFPFQLTATVIIYWLGYFKTNPAWLLCPLIVSIIRDKWKLEEDLKNHIQMASVFEKECTIDGLNVDMLPPWAVYPDVDRCEWLNKLFHHLWPYLTHCLTKIIENELVPKIKRKFHSFKFQRVDFGDEPPQITGVKVFERNVSRNEIIIDLNLFYAGNCDFSFSLFGLSGGIQNLQVRGWFRVIMKPLLAKVPFFGGLEITFLRKPKVDFDLIGLIQIVSLPGLKGSFCKLIEDSLASKIVTPNKIYISLVDQVQLHQVISQEPVGVLQVNVVEAIDLVPIVSAGMLSLESVKPYVEVHFAKEVLKSLTVEEPLSPEWNYWSEFVVDFNYDETLLVKVLKGDDFIGEVSLQLRVIEEEKQMDKWFELENTESGQIHLNVYYYKLSSDQKDYKDIKAQVPTVSSSVLVVYIDSAQNLLNSQSWRKPNVEAQVIVGNQVKTSKTVFASDNPVFQESFTFLIKNPGMDRFRVKFIDSSQSNKVEMGLFSFHLWKLLYINGMEIVGQRFPLLESASESSVVLSMKLKIFIRNSY